ncbi:MAG: GNAT family N-acetyltransferase [Candidatus Helarchaeota archaeon]
MSEIFFAKYYKFFRYEKKIDESDKEIGQQIPKDYKIRELDPDNDYEKFKSAWIKIYSKIIPEPYVKFQKQVLLKYPQTYILESPTNEITGFIVCFIKKEENKGKILRIGIQDTYRKKGFGLLLYHKACEYFLSNNITNIYFDIYEDDHATARLAEKAGFEKKQEFFITIDDPIENFINLSTIMSL